MTPAELSTSPTDPPAAGVPVVTPVPPLPPPAPDATTTLDYATPAGAGEYRAGTLTYTRGGLVGLYLKLLGGDFFWQLRERAIAPAVPLLLRQFGASDFVTGILLGFVPHAVAVVLAPIVSYRSDRHRGRFGRRIPFLLIATPPAFLAMVGLALSPMLGRAIAGAAGVGTPSGVSACIIGVFAVFWFLFDIAVVVTNSVHQALVNDVVPREVIGKFFGCFRFVSLGAGMLFSFFLLGKMEQHYVAILCTIAGLYLACFTVMCLLVKEGEYPPPPPPIAGGGLARFIAASREYGRECFTKPYYLWFFLSFLLANMAFAPVNLFSLYFAQSVEMSMATYGKFSALQLACSLVQAPILGWFADKIHPLRLTIVALVLYAVSTGLAFLFVRDARTFAASHVICGTISGFWLTATAPLAPALLPKLKFATFASVLVIAQALGQIITAPIMGGILERLNHGKPPALRDYGSIYLWACVFITLSLGATMVVHRYFAKYGGRANYVAPE